MCLSLNQCRFLLSVESVHPAARPDAGEFIPVMYIQLITVLVLLSELFILLLNIMAKDYVSNLGLVRLFNVLKEVSSLHQDCFYFERV